MKIHLGSCRLVIVVGPFAIKIARNRLLQLLIKLIWMQFFKVVKVRFQKRYGERFLTATRNYLAKGFDENNNEWSYYCETFDPRVGRVINRLLWGCIVVQRAAVSVTKSELATDNPVRELVEMRQSDLRRTRQYGRIDGRVVVVDFGNSRTVALLYQSLNGQG